jgi:hypothetical protein
LLFSLESSAAVAPALEIPCNMVGLFGADCGGVVRKNASMAMSALLPHTARSGLMQTRRHLTRARLGEDRQGQGCACAARMHVVGVHGGDPACYMLFQNCQQRRQQRAGLQTTYMHDVYWRQFHNLSVVTTDPVVKQILKEPFVFCKDFFVEHILQISTRRELVDEREKRDKNKP